MIREISRGGEAFQQSATSLALIRYELNSVWRVSVSLLHLNEVASCRVAVRPVFVGDGQT